VPPGAVRPGRRIRQPDPPIKINEVLTASPPPGLDTIELLNPTGSDVTLGGWFLTDDNNVPKKFRIPDGTVIRAGDFVVFDERHFNAVPGSSNSFALSSRGEKVYLFSADLAGNLTGYDHGFAFGAAAEGVSFGRHIISTGHERFPPQISFTPARPTAVRGSARWSSPRSCTIPRPARMNSWSSGMSVATPSCFMIRCIRRTGGD